VADRCATVVRRFDVHVGECAGCHRRIQARHALQTSDALGAAAVQIGPQAIALAVTLNKQFGLSFGKIATVFRTRFALHVTPSAPSALVRALHRAAAQSEPTYAALCETVRTSSVVVPDETGWKVRGLLHWLRVFATATTTVYRIRRGRGFRDAASVLGTDFAGGLGRDGWAPYRQFTEPSNVCGPSIQTLSHAAAGSSARPFAGATRAHPAGTRSRCVTVAPPARSPPTASMSRAAISSTRCWTYSTIRARSRTCSASRAI
jgi:hypothetical protein